MVPPAGSIGLSDPDAKLSELVVIMAHDLKNLLAALSANLHFLEGSIAESVDTDSVEALSDSVTLCNVLDHFLRNLDLIGRSDDNKIAVHKNLTSLRAIAGEVAGRFQREAKSAGVDLDLVEPGDRDVVAFVDRDLISRAVDNLVGQALENAPRGTRVRMEVGEGGGESWLSVIDAREAPPPSLRVPSSSPSGTARPSSSSGRQGRGLRLHCADIAARVAGARLEQSGGPGECRLRLVAPSRQ
jgi:K+-sensing histidine kinase KdpD